MSTALYLVKVLHLVSICEPGLFVLARLDDKHLVVCEHLGESVGEDLANLDVELVHLQLLLITLKSHVLIAAGILSHLQLVAQTQEQHRNKERREKKRGTRVRVR